MLRKVELEPEKEKKILMKLYSLALTKMAMGESGLIGIPQFKHIIGSYKVRRSCWFFLAKKWESSKFLTLHGTSHVEIHLSYQSLMGLYKSNLRINLHRPDIHFLRGSQNR